MAALPYIVYFSNSTTGGTPVTGLTPIWVYFNSTSTNTPLSQPAITELDHGCYKFIYDADVNGEARGQIDGGVSLTVQSDRFITSTASPSIGVTQLTESYAADTVVPTVAQLLFEVRALLAENNVVNTTVTTRKIDGSTTAKTYAINSAISPTSITTTS